jgi:hypothetical protein
MNCKFCIFPMTCIPTQPDFRCFECPECHFVVIESVPKASTDVAEAEFEMA